jgi:hypothetical protein
LPFIIEAISSPPVTALDTFFEHQPETATDYDELLLMNRAIEEEIR